MAASTGTPMVYSASEATYIPNWYKNKYSMNVELLYQQKNSKLLPHVKTIPSPGGEYFVYDFLADWEMDQVTTRNAATSYSAESTSRRMVGWTKYAKAYPIDAADSVALLLDPQSPIAVNHARAMARRLDLTIYNACFGDVTSGHAGASTVSWASGTTGYTMIDHGSTGLTRDKLLQAKEALEANDVDLEDPEQEPTLICHTTDANNLLRDTELTSADYMYSKAFETGKIPKVLGINIVTSNACFASATTYRRCALIAKDAIRVGIPKPPMVRVSENPQYHYRTEVYASLVLGAMRAQEEGVVEIRTHITSTVAADRA